MRRHFVFASLAFATMGVFACGSGFSNDTAAAASSSASTGGAATVAASTGGASSTGGGVCTGTADTDGDGMSTCDGDCDDNDPTVYKGAPEICGDGKDNNCDGQIDENCDGLGAFVATNGDDTAKGTEAHPLKTITKGIAQAHLIQSKGGYAAVFVKHGQYAENVDLVEGVSLLGSFDDNWVSDPKKPANLSTIAAQRPEGLVAGSMITRNTLVTGFVIQGLDGATRMSASGHTYGTALTIAGGSPNFTSNLINGPNETDDSYAVTILAPTVAPAGGLLLSNKITGGTSTGGVSYGVAMSSETTVPLAPGVVAEIDGNVISGGQGQASAGIAAEHLGEMTTFFGNVVSGGNATFTTSLGIVVSGPSVAGSVLIDSNVVNSDTTVATCTSLVDTIGWCGGIADFDAPATIVNNVALGVASPRSAGLWLRVTANSAPSIVVNSNFFDGGGNNGTGSESAGIVLGCGGASGMTATIGSIRNNIIEGGSAKSKVGLEEDASALGNNCRPAALENNDLFLTPGNTGAFIQSTDGSTVSGCMTLGCVNSSDQSGDANLVDDPEVDATYHLKDGSPCIDAGTSTEAPKKDIDGESRPKNGKFDIGPDEH